MLRAAIAALLLLLLVGCNTTTTTAPSAPGSFVPSFRPSLPGSKVQALPPLPAEIALPEKPVANTVYDLGKCEGDVPAASPNGFVLVVFAFNSQARPYPGVSVKGDGIAAETDANGRAQALAPVATKSVTLSVGEKSLPTPVTGRPGACRVLAAYFG